MNPLQDKPKSYLITKYGVAKKVKYKWEELARALYFDEDAIRAIKRDTYSVGEACNDVISRWLAGQGDLGPRNWRTLLEALREIGNSEFANVLETKLDGASSAAVGYGNQKVARSGTLYKWQYIGILLTVAIVVLSIGVSLFLPHPTTTPVQDSHKERLQQLYLAEKEDVTDDEWPPVKKVAFVRLAMVNPERAGNTVKVKFQRETIRGSADDILYEKKEVQFHEIFEFEKGSSGARILIEGRPGSGKTTLMRKISRDWANGSILTDCTLFILVPLRQLPNKDEVTLEDLVGYDIDISRKEVKDLVSEIEEMKGLGVCFALDGVDEYSAAASETGYIYELFNGKKLRKSCVIITSRPLATISFRSHTSTNRHIEVIGFMSEDVDQYIREYYREQPEKSQQLQKYLDDRVNIQYMCYLPVNLAIIVWLFDYLEPGESLPDRETDIYESFTINSLVRQVQTKDGIKPFSIHTLYEIENLSSEAFPPEMKRSFYSICKLAFQGYLSGKLVFTERELLSTITHTFGLLTTDQVFAPNGGGTDKGYSFLHLTFQEFLAAVHLTTLLPEEQMKFTEELLKGQELSRFEQKQKCQKLEEVLKFYAGLTKLKSQHSIEVFKQSTRHCIEISITVLYESESTKASKWFVNEVLEGMIVIAPFSNITIMADCNKYKILALVYVLAHNNDAIKELTLEMETCISPEHWLVIMKQVGPLPNLKSLRVNSWAFEEDFLAAAPSLGLQLPQPPAGVCFGMIIGSLFGTLEEISSPNDEVAVTIGKALETGSWPNLRVLELDDCHFGDMGVVALAKGLRNHSKLEELVMRHGNLSDEEVVALGKALTARVQPNLRILNLAGNNFGDKGAVALGHALAAGSWPNLRILRLHNNHIGDVGIAEVATGLRNHTKLEELDICGNEIGDEGFHQLVKVLDGLPQSVTLRFDDTGNKRTLCKRSKHVHCNAAQFCGFNIKF